jgi:hypothetical protein
MEWPIKEDGKFRTTPTAIQVWEAAVEAVLVPLSSELERKMAWMEKIATVENWRTGYYELVEDFVRLMAHLPPDEALLMARTGLETLHEKFVFRKGASTVVSAKEAFSRDDIEVSWATKFLKGKRKQKVLNYLFPLASPTGKTIYKNDAVAQLQAWVNYGCMEPSAALHASKTYLQGHVDISKHVFVLLGATSEIGPAKCLLKVPRAHVLAVARPGKRLRSLAEWFHNTCPTDSTLVLPGEGADLLTEGPQIAKWIVDTVPKDKQVVICHLAYMDGEAHVRTSVAMDLISKYVSDRHPNVALSFLSSPSTVMVIPPDAVAACKAQSKEKWHTVTQYMSFGRWLKEWDFEKPSKYEQGLLPAVLNGMSHTQGPNYALAKTMQQWRCMVACSEKQIVSAPMAPATRTQNMVSNSKIASLLEGMQRIEPLVTFNVDTASTLMTAILLSQVTSPPPKLAHPLHAMWDGSVHGGVWRCPFSPESVHTVSYVLGQATRTGYIPPKSLSGSNEIPEQKVKSSLNGKR